MTPSAIYFTAYAMAYLPLLLALLVRPSLTVSTTCTAISIALLATTHHFVLKNQIGQTETEIHPTQIDPLFIVLSCFALVTGALIYHLRRN